MMSTQRDTQTCKFRFTLNNVTEDHPIYDHLLDDYVCYADSSQERFFTYVCIAPELAPTTGTPHCQGYCFTSKPVRLQQVVKKFNEMGFVEHQHPFVAKCTHSHEENYNYVLGMCEKKGFTKNEKFKEFGVRPTFETQPERQRRNYQTTRDLAMAGRFLEIDPQHFICHFRSIVGISDRYAQPPADLTDVCGIWIWGEPGTGKSYMARTSEELYGETTKRFYVKNSNKWWCGFRAEDHDRVIIEDFEMGAGITLGHYLKLWADRYAFQGEIKGGSAFIRPKTITVTSNYHPLEVFSNSAGPEMGESMAHAILRRFRVYKMAMVGEQRTCTYESETGTLKFRMPGSTGTVSSFNLSPVEFALSQGRTVVLETPDVIPATPVAVSANTSDGGSTVMAPMEKSTAGSFFRTPEAPRNLAYQEYMRDRHVPTAGTQPLTEDEESDDECEPDEDEADKADLVEALASAPKPNPQAESVSRVEVVDLTADSDEEKKDTPRPKPPVLSRSQTIYNAVRTAPAQLIEDDKKRARTQV